jgi:hypothetical protein
VFVSLTAWGSSAPGRSATAKRVSHAALSSRKLCCAVLCAVQVLLLNNQHLGMVVQWEDRFYKVRGMQALLG